MNRKQLRILSLSLLTAAVLCLAGCAPSFGGAGGDLDIYDVEPTPEFTPSPDEVTMVVTPETISQLDSYPNLKTADLTGSTCYPEMKAYMESHPDVKVLYTVEVMDKTIRSDLEMVNLAGMTQEQFPEVSEALQYLPKLKYVELVSSNGSCDLTMEQVKTLQGILPEARFNYNFDLFGQQFNTGDKYIVFENTPIGDEGLGAIRTAMDIMPDLYSVSLDKCEVSTPAMAQLREDYPDVQVDWRLYFGTKFNCMTNEDILRLTDGLYNDNVADMKYLTKARYVDIGHNDRLSDISFLQYMPDLELLIVSGAAVKDLTPLANAKNLEYLELVFCGNLTDLSPLAGCENLKYLNISMTLVKDLTPLDNLPIERFNCLSMKNLPNSQREHFKEKHPDCLSVFNGSQPYGYGWRYTDYGYTFWEYYANMRIIFDYDNKYWYTGRT